MEQKEANFSNKKSFWIKAIEATIIALIISVPLFFYPYIIDIFNPVKGLIFEILVILGMMFWGFKVLDKEQAKIISFPLNFPILSFVAICALSLLWSDSPFVSLKELPLFLSGPLLYFIVVNNIYDKLQINRILNAILIVGGLFGIYGILQYNGIDFSFWIGNYGRGKVFGLFGNTGYFAEYLILPLPIAMALFFVSKNKIKKTLLLIGILAITGALLATLTRGPYLAAGISFIFMIILFLISRGKNFLKENKKMFIFILLAIVLINILFVIPNPLNKPGTIIYKIKERSSINQIVTGSSLRRRIAIWKFTGTIIKDYPLLGSGIGTFKYNSLRYQARFFNQGENRSLYPYGIADKAHNEYLQLGAELGIIGLGIFIWLIISYFNYGLKALKRAKDNYYKQGIIIGLMGCIVAFLVDSLFWFPMHLPATIVLFWLVLGLTMAVIGIKVDAAGTINPEKKSLNQKIEKNKTEKINKKEKIDESNLYRFKPLLYIVVILLIVFLCITIARPFIAQTYWYYGFKEIKKENWNKAIKIYEEALKRDPYLGEVYYDIGKILQNKEFYTLAKEYFEKAEKYIDHPDLSLDLAIIYLKKGLLDKAAIKLKQAISYQRDEESMLPLYSELGNIYLQLQRYKPAEIAFKNALKIDPNFINSHYGLAGAYLNQNKIDEGLGELKKVIELDPDSQEAKYARDIMQKITQEKLKDKDNN